MSYYRSIFISDLHLGIKYSRVEELIKFLKENDCDTLYLVGDIIDGWALKRRWFWDNRHNLFIQKLLRKARKGTKVIYISGNHDEFLRFFEGPVVLGNIEIHNEVIHKTADGKSYLIIHGDKFDGLLNNMDWISHFGSAIYDWVLWLSDKINVWRRKFGMRYWSLSQVVKFSVKKAVKYMTNFEHALAFEAKTKGVYGVICGHVHHACHKNIDGIQYYNCGSWLEHCNVIVEHNDGRLEIINIA
jgi:UDP-2,3-diacylglucosamine pyrophosphatase LpxH